MDVDALLERLDPSQQAAVTEPTNPLCVEAGAGSGKTRVITARIAHRIATEDIDPRRVLVLTFTRRAAAELVGRLRELGLRDSVAAGTFHALALQQLRDRWASSGTRPPAVLDRKLEFVARLVPSGSRFEAPEVVAEIEWAKARGVLPAQYEVAAATDGRRTPVPAEVVSEIFSRYETTKEERRLVDFDDLLRLCCRDLTGDPAFAAAQHWRFRHVFVDEFQDVNPLQFSLLQGWLGTNTDLCVVGDPRQAIYGWNGADAHFLTDFEDFFPGARRISLEMNHRSTRQIIAAGHAALADPGLAQPTSTTEGELPEIHRHSSDRDEAAGIARRVRDMRPPGSPWRVQAVLVRTHRQIPAIRDALAQAGIPHRVRTVADRTGFDRATAASPRDDAVDLVTFHASKGLEWQIVHVAGLEEGFVPISHAQTPDALEEERRLLHVALTRAQRALVCSSAATRTFRDLTMERSPSPWLAPIEQACLAAAESPDGDWRNHLATVRAELSGVDRAS